MPRKEVPYQVVERNGVKLDLIPGRMPMRIEERRELELPIRKGEVLVHNRFDDDRWEILRTGLSQRENSYVTMRKVGTEVTKTIQIGSIRASYSRPLPDGTLTRLKQS